MIAFAPMRAIVVREFGSPNVIIADFPLRWTVAGMTRFFEHGVSIVVPSQRAIPATYLEAVAIRR